MKRAFLTKKCSRTSELIEPSIDNRWIYSSFSILLKINGEFLIFREKTTKAIQCLIERTSKKEERKKIFSKSRENNKLVYTHTHCSSKSYFIDRFLIEK